jgi:hypothetical protein
MAELTERKQQLEIAKLELEMRYLRRNHFAQLFNTMALVFIALLVFYFFQRPQIDQMEIARKATQEHQVAGLVLTAMSLNERDRVQVVQSLHQAYPDIQFLASIAKSNSVLASSAGSGQGTPGVAGVPAAASSPSQDPVQFCILSSKRLAELKKSEDSLREQSRLAEAAPDQVGRRGCGATCQSLRSQANKVAIEIDTVTARRAAERC